MTAVRLLLGGAFLNTLKLEKWCQKNRENLVNIRMLILQSKESRTCKKKGASFKVHIFWEGHKILRNLHLTYVLCSASQKLGEDFAKLYGLLRIYEL